MGLWSWSWHVCHALDLALDDIILTTSLYSIDVIGDYN